MDRGEYLVVYATLEVLLQPRSHFTKVTMKKDNAFKQNLALIAMDEAHTIWGYRRFRSQFKQVGKLHKCFPEIPFVALSATFPPHVIAYIRKVCKMKSSVDMITVSGRRGNIDLLVMEQHTGDTHEQLLELIPSREYSVSHIP